MLNFILILKESSVKNILNRKVDNPIRVLFIHMICIYNWMIKNVNTNLVVQVNICFQINIEDQIKQLISKVKCLTIDDTLHHQLNEFSAHLIISIISLVKCLTIDVLKHLFWSSHHTPSLLFLWFHPKWRKSQVPLDLSLSNIRFRASIPDFSHGWLLIDAN